MGIYVILTAGEKMPASCYGAANYRKIALVELDPVEYGKKRLVGKEAIPQKIDERLKLIKSIPFYRGRLYKGSTDRCAYAKAQKELAGFCQQHGITPINGGLS